MKRESRDLEEKVRSFLQQNRQTTRPLLLGFSGGKDSLVLAQCLRRLELDFHLAHFDHGWRSDSHAQKGLLKTWADGLGIPFHARSDPHPILSEGEARSHRFAFFEELFGKGDYQALLLAHHLEDQAETVLKRVFEGAQLFNLKGMQKISVWGQMPIWRPMLEIPQAEILSYLENENLSPLEDPTNADTRFLRARMRKTLIPQLAKEFGKEIAPPLSRMGRHALLLDEFLTQRGGEIPSLSGPFGTMWEVEGFHFVEVAHLLRQKLPKSISFHHFDRLQKALEEKRSNHALDLGVDLTEACLVVDRGRIFYLESPPPKFRASYPLAEGKIQSDDWEWKVTSSSSLEKCDWKQVWQGKGVFAVKMAEVQKGLKGGVLVPPGPVCRKLWRKLWNEKGVPAFLREVMPIVEVEHRPVAQCLIPLGSQSLSGEDWEISKGYFTISIEKRSVRL